MLFWTALFAASENYTKRTDAMDYEILLLIALAVLIAGSAVAILFEIFVATDMDETGDQRHQQSP